MPETTLRDLLVARAAAPVAPALLAPARAPLTFSDLLAQVDATRDLLAALGLGPGDAIAVVAPNGPEMATAFLGIAATAICAPLNPAYQAAELEFYLEDLGARAVVVAAGLDSPVRDVARRRGAMVLELEPSAGAPAGAFRLTGGSKGPRAKREPVADDVALVLHTSGTTSRPKMVPLTQRNLLASARNIGAALALGPADRCLNVMPLFHIHGLVAALLSSLAAGGSVVCTPGFIAPSFFDWLRAFAPTWYTAVPTMHQAVVARAAEHRSTIENARLRFIRSSSAALPRQTLAELERAFGVPVIEAYGMTEAAHQMASNPLPPRERKAGTVGTAAGPEIAIMDADGQLLQAGEIGEVVIRGENVTRGYAANPAANAAAFAHGWLRTGDQGSLDAEGYLTLSGRLKEQINRAGEKISPLEVDEILMDHAGVAQALTFAVPHPTLGEDVGAAVVRRPDSSVTERQLREFASLRLSYFKVPRRIVFLDEIPKGATGKLQRIGLAQRLGVTADAAPEVAHVAPRTPIEEIIASLWVEVLRSEVPGVHDDFFRAGGDSLLATQLVARIRDALAVELSLLDFFDASTIAGLASIADARVTGVA